MSKLLKNPAEALVHVRKLQRDLSAISSRFMFTEGHAADLDLETNLFDCLCNAENECNRLIDKLIDMQNQPVRKEAENVN